METVMEQRSQERRVDTLRPGSLNFWRGKVGEKTRGFMERMEVAGEVFDTCVKELVDMTMNLEEKSLRDWMTGSLQRGPFLKEVGIMAQLSTGHPEEKGCLAVMDLDNFGKLVAKRAPDGKLTKTDIDKQADDTLRELVKLINGLQKRKLEAPGGEAWKNVKLGRLGGEEFGILIGNASKAQVGEMLEEIRKEIESELAKKSNVPGVDKLTASFGVVMLDENVEVSDAMRQADTALYLAKEQGKNRVVFVGEIGQEKVVSSNRTVERKQVVLETSKRRKQMLADEIEKGLRSRPFEYAETLVNRLAQLEQNSFLDSLTGVLHRGAGDQVIMDMIRHASTINGDEVRVVVMDINNFKGINTEKGHDGGDKVLKETADVLREVAVLVAGEGAVVIRWAPGGTFVIVGAHGKMAEAEVVDRIKSLVKQKVGVGSDVVMANVSGLLTSSDVANAVGNALGEEKRKRKAKVE